jgi:hypothetical protein
VSDEILETLVPEGFADNDAGRYIKMGARCRPSRLCAVQADGQRCVRSSG